MTTLNCKICGGMLEISGNESVATCEYCGRTQTLPRLDDETRARRYDRANHHRRNNDYDKAMELYEHILDEDPADSEAYWSLMLCRYGIVYVEDQKTGRHIPTMNRVQYASILADEDYKSALKYADSYQRQVYEEDAKEIYQIQKRFLEISQKEEPFDVFISYKDKDDLTGQPTQDRAIAMELYNRLHRENLKVFFSHFTLDNKLGEEYEPYIFSALNSAKVMIVLGTKKEYFEATWVKNEWSRFHSLIQNGAKKTLIAAYKNMDAYDLPAELDMQAQDMDKMGFLENLVYVVCREVEREDEKKKASADANASSPSKNKDARKADVHSLLKRAVIFLEDKDWRKANSYAENVLNIDPENAYAYLVKLMAEFQISNVEDFRSLKNPFDGSNCYKRLIKYADEKLKKDLEEYLTIIKDRIYELGISAMKCAKSADDFTQASYFFHSIPGYRDADIQLKLCQENASKEAVYQSATQWLNSATYSLAYRDFQSISGYKDSSDKAKYCKQKMDAHDLLSKERQKRLDKRNEYAQKKHSLSEQIRTYELSMGSPLLHMIYIFLLFGWVLGLILLATHFNMDQVGGFISFCIAVPVLILIIIGVYITYDITGGEYGVMILIILFPLPCLVTFVVSIYRLLKTPAIKRHIKKAKKEIAKYEKDIATIDMEIEELNQEIKKSFE